MAISCKIHQQLSQGSWIRKMFEEGAKLRQIHGNDKVFDFSLGNPDIPPPAAFDQTLKRFVENSHPGDHGYMANIGYAETRRAVAAYLSTEQNAPVEEQDIVMTCGAAGALNVAFKTLLDVGEEIISPIPTFVDYRFYVDNHGGVLKLVPSKADFSLDLDAIGAAINEKTKAVLINSPHNPTGQVYTKESIRALGALLMEKGKALGKTIYLISDEPYRKIVYDGVEVSSIFDAYPESLICASYSKDLSVPGERIGFLAASPFASDREVLRQGMAYSNRVLGYINAPALMQRVIAQVQGITVDVSIYKRRRDLLCEGLAACGYEFIVPKGAFYLFPKSPIPDDVGFVKDLQKELILTVPGSGFGLPGYFRIAYCVEDTVIAKAMPGFKRAMERVKG
jgi:aspartate aminotransferase